MGVDVTSLDLILRYRGSCLGRTLMLGRQGFHIEPENLDGQFLLKKYGFDVDLLDLRGYCEPLFRMLGASEVVSLDFSAFEGAEIIRDLNEPVGPDLAAQFDTVFDGGTLEHVYNFPVAIENAKSMVKIGGVFLMATTANNFLGHGMYQFSPELMWRVFSKESGFEVETMQLVDTIDPLLFIDCVDPAECGKRIEIMTTRSPTYLLVAARKHRQSHRAARPQQSDYVTSWNAFKR